MKKPVRLTVALCTFACLFTFHARSIFADSLTEDSPGRSTANTDIPHLETRDGMTKLIVDGQPFICIAGELANTTSSDADAMKSIFPRLAADHLNTVLSVVSWDLVEPEEGQFDFSMVDSQIALARENNLRLVLLWMGSWKNGLSHFPPRWVKADQARFPRVINGNGNSLEILSTLGQSSRDADAAAFAAVMRHIRQVDVTHRVIAMQVENEVGVLGSKRDFSPAANDAFAKPVPQELIDYLQKNKGTLRPELKKLWDAAGDKTSGTWEDVFGKNVENSDPLLPNPPNRTARPADFDLLNHTDEIFMAWNYSRYIGYVAAAGKREYPIPMYVNAWLVQPPDRGAGDYPSGGAEPLVHDIWRAGGPAIDILAPDIYLPEYSQILHNYARNGNPAWNPETSQNSMNCWTAFTELNALCYSPFGVDDLSPTSPLSRTYGLINSVSGAIAQAQGKPDAIKLLKLEPGENPGKVEMGNYVFDFTPAADQRQRGGGAGRGAQASATPATQSAAAIDAPPGRMRDPGLAFLNNPFILIIHTSPDEYYFVTNGDHPFVVSLKSPSNDTAAPATIDRGYFKDGKWILVHRYNGDDIMGRGYDISAAAANHQSGTEIPLGYPRDRSEGAGSSPAAEIASPVVFRVTFYQYH
jgi:hypothetical protein